MSFFDLVELYTDPEGWARFRTRRIALGQGQPQTRLSALMPCDGLQLRESPVGFSSDFHITTTPQWVFILQGQMEIRLQDQSTRLFGPGQHFYSNDTLPEAVAFNPSRHGHASRQVGLVPLVTAFVRSPRPTGSGE